MSIRLIVLAVAALLVALWFGIDGYLRLRRGARGGGQHGYMVVACRLTVALGVPAFVVAYALGADIAWAVAGPPLLLLTCGLVEWAAPAWLTNRSSYAGSLPHLDGAEASAFAEDGESACAEITARKSEDRWEV